MVELAAKVWLRASRSNPHCVELTPCRINPWLSRPLALATVASSVASSPRGLNTISLTSSLYVRPVTLSTICPRTLYPKLEYCHSSRNPRLGLRSARRAKAAALVSFGCRDQLCPGRPAKWAKAGQRTIPATELSSPKKSLTVASLVAVSLYILKEGSMSLTNELS